MASSLSCLTFSVCCILPPIPAASLSSPPPLNTFRMIIRPSAVADGLTRPSKNDLSQPLRGSPSYTARLKTVPNLRGERLPEPTIHRDDILPDTASARCGIGLVAMYFAW